MKPPRDFLPFFFFFFHCDGSVWGDFRNRGFFDRFVAHAEIPPRDTGQQQKKTKKKDCINNGDVWLASLKLLSSGPTKETIAG